MTARWTTVLTLALALMMLGCKNKSDPAGANPAGVTTVPTTPESGATDGSTTVAAAVQLSDACDAPVRHVYALLAASDQADHRVLSTAEALANALRRCRDEAWPAELLACSGAATTVDEIVDKCNKLAFTGDVDLRTVREIDALSRGENPPRFTVDGDFVVFNRKARCGMLFKQRYGSDAMFITCGGKVVAGPLTTPTEIHGVMGELSARSADAHALTMRIMNNYPSGCGTQCRYRVYDANGRHLRDE
jgi:hypothetical protein